MSFNLIKSAFLASLILVNSGITQRPKIDANISGFNEKDGKIVLQLLNNLNKNYFLPYKLNMRCGEYDFEGETRETSFQNFDILIGNPSNLDTNLLKEWVVPYRLNPLETIVNHEFGHMLFDSISKEEKLNFINRLSEIDKSYVYDLNGKSLLGSPSFYAHLHKLPKEEEISFDLKDKFASEQFAEISSYIFQKHDYQDKDPIFMAKKREVEKILSKKIRIYQNKS